MVDYLAAAKAFRAKAAATNFPEEAKTLLAKAEELEAKYGNASSPLTDDTTVTSRDGHRMTYSEWLRTNYDFVYPTPPPPDEAEKARRRAQSEQILFKLFEQQWKWNSEYYDQEGNPKKPKDEDEDYGYDIFTEESKYHEK